MIDTSRKMAVDLDGVVIDLVSTMLPKLTELAGRSVSANDIVLYDIDVALEFTQEQKHELWAWLMATSAYDVAPPIEGAVSALLELGPRAVTFLTARKEPLRKPTERWLERHELGDFDLLMDVEHGRGESASQFDVVVDDNPKCVAAAAHQVDLLLLYDQPWNRSVELPDNVVRVASWRQILHVLDNGTQR